MVVDMWKKISRLNVFLSLRVSTLSSIWWEIKIKVASNWRNSTQGKLGLRVGLGDLWIGSGAQESS